MGEKERRIEGEGERKILLCISFILIQRFGNTQSLYLTFLCIKIVYAIWKQNF